MKNVSFALCIRVQTYSLSICDIFRSASHTNFPFTKTTMARTADGSSDYDFIFKLVLIGDSAVGKVR